MQRFMSEGTLALNDRNIDTSIIDMLRVQPNLHTVSTHVFMVELLVDGLPRINLTYGDADVTIDFGKAINCIIVSRKGIHDEREVNLEIEEGVLQERGERWRQRINDLEEQLERLRNL